MKDSIHYFKLNRGEISSDELGYSDKEHGLFNLWNSLRNFLDDNSQVKSICKIIKEVDDLDKGSTTFRYAFKHNNGRIVEYDYPATMIDVSKLKIRMLQLFHFYEGVNSLARESVEIDTY